MHLYNRFKDRFGATGVVIGVIALVLALVTGAYAAGGGLSSKQKKEVTKIAKRYAGQDGAPGAQGPKGTPGTPGANGSNGSNGKSVIATPVAPGGTCTEGGTEFEVGESGNSETVCNGEEGLQGPPGVLQPGETLCHECSETGAWARVGGGGQFIPISFNIPLAVPMTAPQFHAGVGCAIPKAGEPFTGGCAVHIIQENGKEKVFNEETGEPEAQNSPVCHGNPVGPTADPGNLCVYVTFGTAAPAGISNPSSLSGAAGAARSGALISESGEADGTWAVTAP